MRLFHRLIIILIFTTLFTALFIAGVAAAQAPSQTSGQTFTEAVGKFEKDVRVGDIIDPKTLGPFSKIYKADDDISFHIYVPPNYDPENPPGVFVYISPSKSGKAAGNWYGRFEKENFIYISANKAGNLVPGHRRMLNAVLAAQYVSAQYKTNPDRTVISGFSGGARMSSLVVENIPGIFEAGIFMGGAIEWRGDKSKISERLGGGAYVFMTGSADSAKGEVQATYKQYKKAGLKHVKFISPRNIDHELPRRQDFAAALSFISQSLGPDGGGAN